MEIKQLITLVLKKPKRLFIIDATGALFSVFMLGYILIKFNYFFGIPKSTLYLLAIIPAFFILLDLYSYVKKDIRINNFLKVISILNILYCWLSMSLAFYHLKTITILGWAYLIVEIIIILILASIQLIVAEKLTNEQT